MLRYRSFKKWASVGCQIDEWGVVKGSVTKFGALLRWYLRVKV